MVVLVKLAETVQKEKLAVTELMLTLVGQPQHLLALMVITLVVVEAQVVAQVDQVVQAVAVQEVSAELAQAVL